VAGGLGLLGEPGTPDARAIFRIAYAPLREPARPPERAPAPPPAPPPAAIVQPPPPAPEKVQDRDGDGVADAVDQCPEQPAGEHPDPLRKGCPFLDRDDDGVADAEDLCPEVAAGEHPDPKRAGCPFADADGDGIADAEDACPDRPGPPSDEPRRNGCPRVQVRSGKTTVLQTVHFARNKDVILATSFKMLEEVARTLNSNRQIRRVSIEGHADDTGTPEWNQKLSERRAKSVMKFLIENGVRPRRLRYEGFGDTRPLSAERTEEARAANRRVEFRILDQR
jgi:outer membrane protein OmpA-like peptidoglycan-associated protein